MLPIRFSFQNCLEAAVGEQGVRPEEISIDAAASALTALRARVDSGEVGFPNLPLDSNTIKEIEEFASEWRGQAEHVLLLGGSSGAVAMDFALHGPHPAQLRPEGYPTLVAVSPDADAIAALLASVNPKKTMLCVVSESTETAETMAAFLVIYEWLASALGAKKAAKRVVAVTDPRQGDLLAIARQEKFRLFSVPANVEDRFNVLSPAGLVPAALTGIDLQKVVRGAKEANTACWSRKIGENVAMQSALLRHALDTKRGKRTEIVRSDTPFLRDTVLWWQQLWEEGKSPNRANEPLAAPLNSQLSSFADGAHDKLFTFWSVDRPREEVRIPAKASLEKFAACAPLLGKPLSAVRHGERRAMEAALTEARRPNCRWDLPKLDEHHLGMFFQLLEFQAAFAGELYGAEGFRHADLVADEQTPIAS
jgi:glucose-6-phosphate isomerase